MAFPRFLFDPAPVVPVLRLHGAIGVGGALARGGLNLADLAGPIQAAFAIKRAKAVALSINSPGGAAVQSALIAGRIRQLAEEKKLPVLAFTEDVCASGGYWLATAADEIWAHPASLVGSIGVISAGFGFPDLMARIGVERRVYTAGSRKSFLDPFRPEHAEDVTRLLDLQRDVHDEFKAQVRGRRGTKLQGADDELFSGDVWSGRRALALGLVDGLGDLRSVLRQRFGERVRLRLVQPRKSWLRRRFGFGALAADGLTVLEERALWARYGL